MKRMIIALLIALPMLAAAQNKCKVSMEVDEFTGDTTFQTEKLKLSALSSPYQGFVFFIKSDGIDFLVLHAHTNAVVSVDKDEVLYVKFGDESVERLKNLSYTISDANYRILTEISQGVILLFPMAPEQLEKLGSSKVVKSRIASSQGQMVFETSPRLASEIMDCAKIFKDFSEK